MKASTSLLALPLALAAAQAAHAQSIYVDCTAWNNNTPSPSYGGPRGVPGTWNPLPLSSGNYPMLRIDGLPSGVVATVEEGCDTTSCSTPELQGDDAALLEDAWNGDCYASPNYVYFNGLEPRTYQLVVVAYGACNPAATATVSVSVGTQFIGMLHSGGVLFEGDWVDFPLGWISFDVEAGETLQLTQTGFPYPGGLAGFQLVRLGADSVPFCFGTLGGCPCGAGADGRGCPSSFEPSGGLLYGNGRAKLVNDTLRLTANGVGNGVVTFLQGDTILAHGLGVPFGDGLSLACS